MNNHLISCNIFYVSTYLRTIFVLFQLNLFLVFCNSVYGQSGVGANFGIEADAFSGDATSGLNTDDWFYNSSSGAGVIDEATAVSNDYAGQLSVGNNIAFDLRQSISNYATNSGYIWYSARYGRDFINDTSNDQTTFSGGKNGDNPQTAWSVVSGSVPSKVDIVDVGVHMRRNGTDITDDLWTNFMISTLSSSGNHFVDFELFVSELGQSGTGFTNSGSQEGHTAWEFDASGNVTTIGDMAIGFAYSGSGVAGVEVRLWVNRSAFNPGSSPGGTSTFTWGSSIDGGSTYGYGQIVVPSGALLSNVNSASTTAAPWGTNNTSGYTTNFNNNHLAEVGINFTQLGFDPRSLFGSSSACDSPFSAVLAKSRTASSFTSALKDFAGPYDFLGSSAGTQVNTTITQPSNFDSCSSSETRTLQAEFFSASAQYTWYSLTPGVVFPANGLSEISGVGLDNVLINTPGDYQLGVAPLQGCNPTREPFDVIRVYAIPCAIDDTPYITENNTAGVVTDVLANDVDLDNNIDVSTLNNGGLLQPTNGIVSINTSTGEITYTPNTDFFGTDTYGYQICDSNGLCAIGTVSVTVYVDTDGDAIADISDLDDDNDGILDIVECPKSVLWVTQSTAEPEEQNTINKLIALGYTVTVVDDQVPSDANNYDVTFIFEDVLSGNVTSNISNFTTTTNGVITSERALHDELVGANQGNATNTNLVTITNNAHPITNDIPLGNYDIGDASSYTVGLTTGTILGYHPDGEASIAVWETGDATDSGTAAGRRVILPHRNDNGPFNTAGEDLLVNAIIWAAEGVLICDTDSDGIKDSLELDSDNDGCNDAIEAGFTDPDDDSILGTSPVIVDANGQVTGQGGYTKPNDNDSNSVYDFQEAGTAPVITTQPDYQYVLDGADAIFTVTASGTILAYQWQVSTDDGVTYSDITGETNVNLTITAVSTSDDGNLYRVLVSNANFSCGEIVSGYGKLVISLDSDNDGILDRTDLDDDNDGILDADEGCETESANFSINRNSTSISLDNASNGIVLDITSIDNSFNISINGNQLTSTEIEFDRPNRTAEFADGTFYGGGGISNIWSIAWNNPTNINTPLIRLVVNPNGRVELYGSKTWNGPLEPMVFVNGLTISPVTWGTTTNTIVLDQIINGNTVMTGRLSSLVNECSRDTDGDGITDQLDLDSDNDGIYDVTESGALTISGANDANNDGVIDGAALTFGSNGLFNSIEDNDTSNAIVNYTLSDSDGDTIYDAFELDSDNDSCNDSIEAGFTDSDDDGVLGNSPVTVDSNGLVTGHGGYTTPADSDTNTIYDFQEAGVAPSISSQPQNATVFDGTPTTFTVIASDVIQYQWQQSTDGGSTYVDVLNGGIYSGVDSNELTISSTSLPMNGYQYRIVLSNVSYACSPYTTSDIALLSVRLRTVITNRRITYRVKKN